MYTHNLENTNKNLLKVKDGYIYLTTDSDFLKGDIVNIQNKSERNEIKCSITEVITDTPLCKNKTFAVVLEIIEN